MEILIVGVLLVALMVYASTKIKKSAASAFETEIIENEDFSLVKPDGFISPIDENSKFAFEAYTKEFGKSDQAEDFRQATANLTVSANSIFETVCNEAKNSADKILSENFLENASPKICLINGEKTENNVKKILFWKIAESVKQQKIFELKVEVLETYLEDYSGRINELLESFAAK